MFSVWLLCVAFVVYLLWRRRARNIDDDAPVISLSLPIIGVTHLFVTDTRKFWDNCKLFMKTTSEQGGVTRGTLVRDTYYFITDPNIGATVANACLDRHFVYKFAECWLKQALILASVPTWRRHRKMLNAAFSLPMIHGFLDVFNEQVKIMIDDLIDFDKKGLFNASPYIENTFLRISCLTTFGANNLTNENKTKKYENAMKELEHIFTNRLLKFWQHSDLIFKLLGLKKKQDKVVKEVIDFSDEIVHNAQTTTNQKTDVRSYLDKYLQLNTNNTLTATELREELEFTIAASYDTTALTFQFILCFLGSYSDIQERLYKEVIAVIGPEKCVDKEDLLKLVYTDAVIKETLRLLPPVPMIARTINDDVKLENCTLRKGCHAGIIVYAINRNASWGPDAEQFRPERWLESGGVPSNRSGFASFSYGKRDCIGKTHALALLKVAVAQFVRVYQIEADYTKLQFKYNVTLKPVEGNEISLKLRNTS